MKAPISLLLAAASIGASAQDIAAPLNVATTLPGRVEVFNLENFDGGTSNGDEVDMVYYAKTDTGNPFRIGEIGGIVTNRANGVRTGDLVLRCGALEAPTEQLRVTSGGFIGMGTSAPLYKLDVVGAGAAGAAVYSHTSDGAMSRIGLQSGTVRHWSISNYGNSIPSLSGYFAIADETAGAQRLIIDANGNVGIGTLLPTNKLTVIGTISAKEVKVTTSGADYVFEDGYQLRPLAELQQFVQREKHLPEIMTAKDMQTSGMPVSEVVTKQLAKIEELTLYAIQQQKVIDSLIDREKARDMAFAVMQERMAAMEATIAPAHVVGDGQ